MTDKKITLSFSIFCLVILISGISLFKIFNKSVEPVFSATTHLVISQIQAAGTTAGDEFVEIYNPTENSVDLTGWRLKEENSTNTSSANLIANMTGSLLSHKYLLVGSPSYSGSVAADQTYSATSSAFTANATIVLYSDAGTTIVDKVGMGTATDNETADAPAPAANGSIQRKIDDAGGHGTDTDVNSADFESLAVSDPRNSSTIIASPSVAPSPSTTPSMSPSPSANPSASPSLSPSPISSPLVSPSPSGAASASPSANPSSSPSSSPSLSPSPVSSPSVSPSASPSFSPSVSPSSIASPSHSPIPFPSHNPVVINTPFFTCTLKFVVLNNGFFRIIFPVFTCTPNNFQI